MKFLRILSMLVAILALSGCATYASYDNLGGAYYDPGPRYSVGVAVGGYYPAPVYVGRPYYPYRYHHHHHHGYGHYRHR
jgi:hypothetical protein